MRLLHTKKLRFQEFFDVHVPKYAILSHRWGLEEVSYQDFLTGAKTDTAGHRKILEACAYAANDVNMSEGFDDRGKLISKGYLHSGSYRSPMEGEWVWLGRGFEWIWIDTCCIDKSSSSELSEAINSMCKWYARSEVCYAYLSDVVGDSLKELAKSQWFTRGWTLQELLAPKKVVFLSKEWQELAQRNGDQTLFTDITGIPPLLLDGWPLSGLANVSTAERFRWAAQRKTSRKEDQAYCLLGLFDVSMPLLYGEGNKAFQRLQRKILKGSSDESIFLWDHVWWSDGYRGMLAESIASFGDRLGGRPLLEQYFSRIPGLTRPPYLVTNQGLQIHVPKELAKKNEILLPLNCQCISQDGSRGAYAIRLERISEQGRWARVFKTHWSECLPPLKGAVRRPIGSFGLFIVPVNWVWSREDLSKRGSEIIYVMVQRT